MNKGELVDAVAEKASVTKKQADAVLTAALESIIEAVSSGDKVTLVGFGSFESRKREAREGRNPKTGAKMNIPATKVPAFSAGKLLEKKFRLRLKPSKSVHKQKPLLMQPVHGGNLAWAAEKAGCPPDAILDFSASISPLGPPQSAIAAIQANLGNLSYYPDPDYRELRAALSQSHQLPPEWILPGNGSAELLTLAGWDLAKLAVTALVTPAFSDYWRCLKAFNAKVLEYPLDLRGQGLGIRDQGKRGILYFLYLPISCSPHLSQVYCSITPTILQVSCFYGRLFCLIWKNLP
jgi:nucleoid DNA-binding protein